MNFILAITLALQKARDIACQMDFPYDKRVMVKLQLCKYMWKKCNVTRGWDPEKNPSPDRIWTHDLPNTRHIRTQLNDLTLYEFW